MVLLEHLGNDPFTTRGVLPLMDPRVPGGYTAVFDGGMVSYQVMADQPWIQLIALILNDF